VCAVADGAGGVEDGGVIALLAGSTWIVCDDVVAEDLLCVERDSGREVCGEVDTGEVMLRLVGSTVMLAGTVEDDEELGSVLTDPVPVVTTVVVVGGSVVVTALVVGGSVVVTAVVVVAAVVVVTAVVVVGGSVVVVGGSVVVVGAPGTWQPLAQISCPAAPSFMPG